MWMRLYSISTESNKLMFNIPSGNQNRIRTINGYKQNEKNKANSDCGGNANCILSDKNAADYWILENSKLSLNRQTISIEQALAQGGVGDGQDLVITQPTVYDLNYYPEIYPYVIGLLMSEITNGG